MTAQSKARAWSAGWGVTGAILGALIAVASIGVVFGGYREKIDANIADIKELKGETNQRLERIENKVDQLTSTVLQNTNAKRK